jgi:hypothetical protein
MLLAAIRQEVIGTMVYMIAHVVQILTLNFNPIKHTLFKFRRYFVIFDWRKLGEKSTLYFVKSTESQGIKKQITANLQWPNVGSYLVFYRNY